MRVFPYALHMGAKKQKGEKNMRLQEAMLLFRAQHNLNQEEFAKLCEVSRQTIHMIEKGVQKPSRFTQKKIELVLKGEKIHDAVSADGRDEGSA